MKKILIVSCVFIPEPVVSAQISKDIAFALNNLGHTITVLAPKPSRPAGFDFTTFNNEMGGNLFGEVLPNVKVVNLNSKVSAKPNIVGRFQESWSFGKEVVRYLNMVNHDFDIVYINSWPIFSQYLIAKACNKLKIPYVVHIQDIYPESLSNKLPGFLGMFVNMMLFPLEKYHLKNAKKIIVISDTMKEEMASSRGLKSDKFEVVYNWQDESSFNLSAESGSQRFTFMYLGNIGPVAGVETLINAFVLAGLSSCDLIIAGNGANKDSCIKIAKDHNATNIIFKDVPNGEVSNTQALANILLLPVIKGGANSSIPSKLPAYMFSAKPIIGTLDINTATANAILDAGCGWVGPAEDQTWLANQMKLVYNMPAEELYKIGRAGFEYGKANFSKESNLDKIINQLIND